MMKTGLVSVSFRRLSPEQIVDLAAECGLEGIEWGGDIHVPPDNIENARYVGGLTRAKGMQVACYGSYYRLTDGQAHMAQQVVDTAHALGAPLIRVWAGDCASRDATPAQRQTVCRNARALAKLAAEKGMTVAFEWHGGTLTDELDSARALLRAVNMPNVRTLWQPPVDMSVEMCAKQIETVGEFVENIHVFSWRGTDRLPLKAGAEKWRACLGRIEKLPGERWLLLEFVQNDAPAQLRADADCLHRWLKGEWDA